uniref:Uncharacterized protein n=1 Tax=Anguilla anguilla TaxID=7936 RepID=A0A0E9TZ47_ANGAN
MLWASLLGHTFSVQSTDFLWDSSQGGCGREELCVMHSNDKALLVTLIPVAAQGL